jgi:hypothetical protein
MKRFTAVTLLAVALVFSPGCMTVSPSPVPTTEASFDAGGANSGVLDITDTHALVTPRFRERYNAMIKIYGEEFVPELKKDYGLSLEPDGKTYRMTLDALDQFLIMNTWRKMGRAQK